MPGLTEMALMFEELDKEPYAGPQIGIVESPPPEIVVIAGPRILWKDQLIIAAHVLDGYKRDLELTSVTIDNQNTDEGDITLRDPPLPTNPATTTSYSIMDLDIAQSSASKISGRMEYVDTLKKGDEVILIPSQDNQTYFLVDKAVRL
ncbi:hypothetical protein BEP19_15845 [Ammoniphilus oxalaticus]|uniref:DUF2577 domain-containing protein n=1 Tax=Ammoniphilus oxalaticus TaxID=66863 RepID=A0A419SQF6_9BACL|nr:DUF2577 domain-containing protein [Ammoniphilus oxalaticus]RKD26679.1 hypothetical protein BEP19_15845 [Ammoniphilus oxalaticus]